MSTQPVPREPASSATPSTPPAPAISAPAAAKSPSPPSPDLAPRRGIFLTSLAVAWLALVLFSASRPPPIGFFWLLLIGIGFLILTALWLAAAGWSILRRSRLGLLGWLAVPIAFLLGFGVPWSSIFLASRVRSNEPALRTLAQDWSDTPDSAPRAIDAHAGGINFTQVTRRADTIALAYQHSTRAETGLLFSPTGAHADPPHWVKTERLDSINANWSRYQWWDE